MTQFCDLGVIPSHSALKLQLIVLFTWIFLFLPAVPIQKHCCCYHNLIVTLFVWAGAPEGVPATRFTMVGEFV